MIKVFYGDDRVRENAEIRKFLGDEYEIVEGAELTVNDLPSLLMGNSLFLNKRKILIRDLSGNKSVSEKIEDYLDSSHDIVIQEQKLAKNSGLYKALSKAVEIREFKLPEVNAYRRALNIYNVAKRDGKKAVEMVSELENIEDPIGFMGMIVSIALKEYDTRSGQKEKRVLKELSKLDIEMKTTSISPWTLTKSFLLRLSSL